jgi:hypothetical protein
MIKRYYAILETNSKYDCLINFYIISEKLSVTMQLISFREYVKSMYKIIILEIMLRIYIIRQLE